MATTGHLIEWLAAGVVTTAGAALASGKARFYQVATLTPKSVFSDDALTAAITQPVTLNAGGSAIVYVDTSVRMIVKDAADTTTLYDVTMNVSRAEQVYVTSSAFNNGAETTLQTILNGWTASAGGFAGLFTYKRSATSTERNLKDAIAGGNISAKDRGAVGNGVANDTAALAAAVAEMSALGGGNVLLEAGNYLIDASTPLSLPANVSLVGRGSASTTITLNHATANAIGVSAAGVGGSVIQGLTITNTGTSTGTGIACVSTSKITIRDVTVVVDKFKTGVSFSACSNTAIYDSFLGCLDTGAGTGRSLIWSTSGINHYVSNTEFDASGTGTCVEAATGASSISIWGSEFRTGAVGVLLTSSDNNDLMRVVGCTGLANNVTTAFSASGSAARMLYQAGNLIDGYSEDVASGGTVTPAPHTKGTAIRFRGTSAGVAITVALPTAPNQPGFKMTTQFFNNVAVTGWTLNAGYHTATGAAAISGTSGDKTTISWEYDIASAVWRELGRTVST